MLKFLNILTEANPNVNLNMEILSKGEITMKRNKKIIALIISVLMILAIPMSAFAAPGSGTPIGTQREQEKFAYEKSLNAPLLINDNAYTEEPFWPYDENHLYESEDGYVWEYWNTEKLNWKHAKENYDWLFRDLEDGTIEASGGPKVNNVVIPSSLDGKTVTAFRDVSRSERLDESENTLSVTIPDTVKEIPAAAFHNKTSIKRIIIGKGVTAIHARAFNNTGANVGGVELDFCGTEEQWNDIVVWNAPNVFGDSTYWAVTNFNWVGNISEFPGENLRPIKSNVNAVNFNVDPDSFDPLVPEEKEEEEPTFFEKLVATGKTIVAKITEFFVVIAGKIKKIFG